MTYREEEDEYMVKEAFVLALVSVIAIVSLLFASLEFIQSPFIK